MSTRMTETESDGEITPPLPTRFTIEEEVRRRYRRYNAEGAELKVRLLPPPDGDDTNPMTHFQASVTELFEYANRDCQDSHMVTLSVLEKVV